MSRFLFVSPPLGGHVVPARAVAGELVRRGHAVGWVTDGELAARYLDGEAPLVDAPLSAGLQDWLTRRRGRGTLETVHAFWERFVFPLAAEMRLPVEEAVDAFSPDVVVADQHALAGRVEARRRGLPWATSAATAQPTAAALDLLPAVREWLGERVADLDHAAGLAPDGDLSPRLTLLYTVPRLAGAGPFPPTYRFVGPPLEGRAQGDSPAPPARDGRPRVLVSLGTSFQPRAAARFLGALSDAVVDEPLDVVAAAPPELLERPPANLALYPWLGQLAVLRQVAAVVSHGGVNTVCESLAFGRPLVLAPAGLDHGVMTARVEELGAGVRVRFARVRADELRDALRRVLGEPSYRARAEELGRELRAAGGAAAAADALEELA